jgi:hypothetical protein
LATCYTCVQIQEAWGLPYFRDFRILDPCYTWKRYPAQSFPEYLPASCLSSHEEGMWKLGRSGLPLSRLGLWYERKVDQSTRVR